jgi:hypothetical protein
MQFGILAAGGGGGLVGAAPGHERRSPSIRPESVEHYPSERLLTSRAPGIFSLVGQEIKRNLRIV